MFIVFNIYAQLWEAKPLLSSVFCLSIVVMLSFPQIFFAHHNRRSFDCTRLFSSVSLSIHCLFDYTFKCLSFSFCPLFSSTYHSLSLFLIHRAIHQIKITILSQTLMQEQYPSLTFPLSDSISSLSCIVNAKTQIC